MKRHHRTRRRTNPEAQLEMTPMIDVVFLLLVFFILAIKPVDVMAHLDVNRPAPDPNADPAVSLVRINVAPKGYMMNGKRMDLATVERHLVDVASLDRDEPIIVVCTSASLHAQLVRLLDVCSKHDLKNLSLGSM